MSRQLEVKREERQQRLDTELVRVVEFGLVGAVSHTGGTLRGFSVKYGHGEVLITLRAVFPAGNQVCFVASSSLSDALRKCAWSATRDLLRWRRDKF